MASSFAAVLEEQLAVLRRSVSEEHERALAASKATAGALQQSAVAFLPKEGKTANARVCSNSALPRRPLVPILPPAVFTDFTDMLHEPPEIVSPRLEDRAHCSQPDEKIPSRRTSPPRKTRVTFRDPEVATVIQIPMVDNVYGRMSVAWKWPVESEHDEDEDCLTDNNQAKAPEERSGLDKDCSRLVVWPLSWKRLTWDIGALVLITLDTVLLPLQAIEPLVDSMDETFFAVLNWVSLVFWSLDFPSQFFVGYIASDGKLEMNFARTSRRYLKTWCLFDIIIIVLDFISVVGYIDSDVAGVLRLQKGLRGLRILRAARLLRAAKVVSLLRRLSDMVNSEFGLFLLNTGKMILVVLFINHYLGCGWYWIGTLDYESGWIALSSLERHSDVYRYITSLHWSLTQFTPSSMDVTPHNEIERTYAVCVVFIGMISFCACISTITISLGQIYSFEAARHREEHQLRLFLGERSVSATMSSRIWEFLRAQRKNRTPLQESEVQMLAQLPRLLRYDLRLEMFGPILQQHPMFRGLVTTDPHVLRRLCDRGLNFQHYPTMEDVFSKGERGRHMFFVVHGQLEYHLRRPRSQRKSQHAATLASGHFVEHGDWLSEGALWFENWVHFGWLRTRTTAELLVVDAEAFRRFALVSPSPYSGSVIYRNALMARMKADARSNEDGITKVFNRRPSDLTGERCATPDHLSLANGGM
eukprot:TRINITY_DN18230_c0_g1_i3.p1 TRINITY_DN18230_c0_g1~~TRINITY_DN18230_c0_g1_i3.p1  ORF type:complete len:701 (+),score=107.39 TRINITY_DN18230_c0_g1_i3:91-2193(+)